MGKTLNEIVEEAFNMADNNRNRLGEIDLEKRNLAKRNILNEDKEHLIEIFKNDKDHLIEMSQVGHFCEYDCVIYSREGKNEPHFHLENIQDEKFIAIKLLKPEYFIHGIWQDKLNSREKTELIKFLNEKPSGKKGLIYKTNFEYIYDTWFYECLKKDPDIIIKMPNYRELQ